jgi:glycosyltransferase involved in cell wall biosynthesis
LTSRRLRVVTLVDTATALGGGERIAMQVAIRLDPRHFESTVCASRLQEDALTDAQRAAHEQLRSAGVRTVALGRSGRRDLAAWRPLLRLLRRERIDVLHAHMFGSNLWGTLIGRGALVPVIVAHEHGWAIETTSPLRRFVDRQVIARWSNAFVTVSEETRRRMIDRGGIDARSVVLVRNGIPSPPPGPAGDLRAELGIARDAPVIGTAAVLRREKALDMLLRGAALLTSRFPGLRVLIAGEGPERPGLERLRDCLGLGDAVVFLGFRADVPAVLATTDVAVFSSASEGSPLAVMEAMEAARPIVATRVGGVPDLIEDGVQGILVPPGDPSALAAAVARALEDQAAGAAMGMRARERRRRSFDIEGTVRQVEQLYEDLYARSTRGRREGFVPRGRSRLGDIGNEDE